MLITVVEGSGALRYGRSSNGTRGVNRYAGAACSKADERLRIDVGVVVTDVERVFCIRRKHGEKAVSAAVLEMIYLVDVIAVFVDVDGAVPRPG